MNRKLYFLLICEFLFFDYFLFANYLWKSKYKYYFHDIDVKINEIVSKSCRSNLRVFIENKIRVPSHQDEIFMLTLPLNTSLIRWWSTFPSPTQMRVEPFLCETGYSRKRPIFNNSGCQLPHYMNPFAPRCQTSYLKWICDNSQLPINSTVRNSIILPESNHQNVYIPKHLLSSTFPLISNESSDFSFPPQPYLMTFRNAIVSKCGDVLPRCGLVHTSANCFAPGNKMFAVEFESKCSHSEVTQNGNLTIYSPPLNFSTSQHAVGEYNFPHTSPVFLPPLSCPSPSTPWGAGLRREKRVFVVGEVDDTYIYHIHLEIVPRIVYHLDFLLENPDIKIMYGCDSKKLDKLTRSGLEQGLQGLIPFLRLLGLEPNPNPNPNHAPSSSFPLSSSPSHDSRLIVFSHVWADEVYLPMEGGCQDPVYNTWQVLNMRERILSIVNKASYNSSYNSSSASSSIHNNDDHPHHHHHLPPLSPSTIIDNQQGIHTHHSLTTPTTTTTTPTLLLNSPNLPLKEEKKKILKMMLLKRSSSSKHTRNGHDSVRQWSDEFTEELMRTLTKAFDGTDSELHLSFEVFLFSDRNETLMNCLSCQIESFLDINVLIGVHGAGLGNMLYMSPNQAVIEIAPYGNDGRCLLGGGPFSRLATLLSHNYLIHHSPYEEFIWEKKRGKSSGLIEHTSRFDIERLVIHVKSFLKSIRFY